MRPSTSVRRFRAERRGARNVPTQGSPATRGVRVVLVEKYRLFARALQAPLERAGGFVVVGVARSGREALQALAPTPVEVLVLSGRPADMSAPELIERAHAVRPAVAVLVLADHEDDETRGHIDNVACFAKPGVVLAASCDDTADANHAITQANLDILRAATDAKGRTLEVLALPQPRRRDRKDGRRLTLSYVNFYIANGVVIVPTFNDRNDRRALHTLAECFPDREVIGIHAVDLVWGLGTLHCLTQQQPQSRT